MFPVFVIFRGIGVGWIFIHRARTGEWELLGYWGTVCRRKRWVGKIGVLNFMVFVG